jgi:hypothetical protein
VELTKTGYRRGFSATPSLSEIIEWRRRTARHFRHWFFHPSWGIDPARIYWEAARQAGVVPAQAAYVADNPARDVPGSRRAGFGMIIIMGEPEELAKKDLTGDNEPDRVIYTLSELLGIFPPRQLSGEKQPSPGDVRDL